MREKTTNPYWDETLFLSAKGVDESSLSRELISIGVYDKDLISRDVVGEFIVDAMHVYYQPAHEIYRTWVALTAPGTARVQGYLRLSVALLGPGDKPAAHDGEQDAEEDGGAILMPPAVKRELVFLRIGVLRALDLPIMDSNRAKGKGIDACATPRTHGRPSNFRRACPRPLRRPTRLPPTFAPSHAPGHSSRRGQVRDDPLQRRRSQDQITARPSRPMGPRVLDAGTAPVVGRRGYYRGAR